MIKKLSSIFRQDRTLPYLLILGCVEFGIAAITSLRIEPDTKNAFLFGYSFSRLLLAGLSTAIAVWLLFLAITPTFRARIMEKLGNLIQKAPRAWGLGVMLLAGLAILVGITPFETFGKLSFYFTRARLFLFIFFLYPAQFSLYWLQARKWDCTWSIAKPFLMMVAVLFSLAGLITLSGWGIIPENKHWNPAGTPLTSQQLVMLLLIGVMIFGLLGLMKTNLRAKSEKYIDLLIIICMFSFAIYSWVNGPIPHNEFSTTPAAPYFQSYPTSDAEVHDLGALSILQGTKIFFGQYTDKPLYMVFLALLHLVGGYDYNLLSMLQAGFMALLVPALYLFGSSFHSRLFGSLLAGIVILRQYNAIILSNQLIYNATSIQFLTEVPTLLGLIFFTWAFFLWVKSREGATWLSFVTGGILGAVTLIRLNPFLLIPAVPVFLFFSRPKFGKTGIIQSLTFLLGCTLMISPWLVTGTDAAGTPYFVTKFYDIINVRYGQIGALQNENLSRFLSPVTSAENTVSLAPLHAGLDFPTISINTFPGFVLNHTLNNFVGAFLTLPDSIQSSDQNLNLLVTRPYWSEGLEIIAHQQIPYLLLNLILLALGMGWAWRRWNWAGLTPVFVFVVYSISLGFGRTSGLRYLVPIDWVVDFYFALGLLQFFQIFPAAFRSMLEAEPGKIATGEMVAIRSNKWIRIFSITLVICLAMLIPISQNLIPSLSPICKPGDEKATQMVQLDQTEPQKPILVFGKVLYPFTLKDNFRFVLLTCQGAPYFDINGFHGKLTVGQQILAGLSNNSPNPIIELIALPPNQDQKAQVLWRR